jgi:hypothetical protein
MGSAWWWWWQLTPFLAQSSSTRELKADTEIKCRKIGIEQNGSISARGRKIGPNTDIQCSNRKRQNNRSNRQRRHEDTANDPNS